MARNSKDALDELAESEDSRLLAVPLLFGPFAAVTQEGTTRLPSPSRTIGMNLSLGDDDDEGPGAAAAAAAGVVVVLLPVMDEDGELLPGVDG